MLRYINNFITQTFTSVSIPNIQVSDIIEVLILTILIYQLAKRIADTRILTVVKGILILLGFYGVLAIAELSVLASIFKWFILVCLICIILAIQPDLRKIMESAGSKNYVKEFISWWKRDKVKGIDLEFNDNTLDALVEACEQMSKTKTGALIVFELDTPLKDIVATGIKLDALITKQLLIQIFEKNTPLHDGAVVIKGDRIESATCYLPLSNNLKINKDLGTRHRAGIGVTEQVDCFVLIISEETGSISWVQNGNIHHKVAIKDLRNILTKIQHRKGYVKKKVDVVKKASKLDFKAIGIAFAVALFTWLTILNIIDPVKTRQITGLNVQVINEEAITSIDQTYEIVDGDIISVTIKGKRSVVDSITKNDIKAIADLEELSKVYAVPIEIKLNNGLDEYITVTYKSKNTMKIKLDSIAEKVVTLEYETTGGISDKCFIDSISSNKESITIKGANSIISTIDRVVLPVDISGYTKSFRSTVKPIIYDRNGKDISSEKLELSERSFDVAVEMLSAKTVPINVNIMNSGLDKCKILNYISEKDKVTVGGTDENLNNLDLINIDVDISQDIKGITSNKLIKTIDITEYISENYRIASENAKLNITIDIETPIEKDIKVKSEDIEVKNVSNKLTGTVKNAEYTLKLRGYKEDLDRLDLEYYISLKGKHAGSGEVELQIKELSDDIEIINTPLIKYELKEK